jgi:hypothetical protein
MFKLLVTTLLVALTAARKSYLVKTERNVKEMPRVRGYDYQRCPRKNEDNYYCIDADVNWEIGWEWY